MMTKHLVCLWTVVVICFISATHTLAEETAVKTYVAPKPPAEVNDWSRDEFQFKFKFRNPYIDTRGEKKNPESDAYVYIPVETKKVRALLLLQQNVIEQNVSVNPAIREVCDANDIAIAWCIPGWDMAFDNDPLASHELIEKQFGAFGKTIGYPELGDVPLILFGHSNTTQQAMNAPESRPERVLAVLTTHGGIQPEGFVNFTGPVLIFKGQFAEWKQQTDEIVENKPIGILSRVHDRLAAGWMPICLIEEYGSGHFDYSDDIMDFFAMFIDKAIKARLDESGALKEIDPASGYIADVPKVPTGSIPVMAYADADPALRARSPWYFDKEMAETAARMIAGNGPWTRKPAFMGFKHPDGTMAEYHRSGIVSPIPNTIEPGTNHITFYPVLLEEMPADFREAGHPLAVSSDPTITIEYNCGAYIYLDEHGDYRVKINRSYPNGYGFLCGRNLGDSVARPVLGPVRFKPWEGRADKRIEIINPGDQKPGATIPLDSGPVGDAYKGYFVDHGPARVVGNELHILPLPANTDGPVEVELTAYALRDSVVASSTVTFDVSE